MNQQLTLILHDLARSMLHLNWQLVTAESCTGGLIASSITELSGSSSWFERGFITYSNLAKQEMLGVPSELLATYGAVSKEVASSMATGALRHSTANVALAVTGIAGPSGGSIEKPVGTVCFAWAVRNTFVHTLKKQFSGNRQNIRSAACQEALHGLLAFIQKPRS
jgi:nicotinamide-nucleotide amidase